MFKRILILSVLLLGIVNVACAGEIVSFMSNANYTDTKYVCVELASGAGKVQITDAAGDSVVGVMQNSPTNTGSAVAVQISGITKVQANAAITKGAEVVCCANGQVRAWATSGEMVIGQALEAATAQGQIIKIKLGQYWK